MAGRRVDGARNGLRLRIVQSDDFSSALASDNAQHATGTSQDDGTPAENPSDTSMATVHLGPRVSARPLFFLHSQTAHPSEYIDR